MVSVTSTKGQGTPQKQDPQQMNSQFRVPPIHPGKQSITQPRVNSALQQRSGQLPSLPRPQSSPVYAPSHPPRGRSAQPATTIHPPSQAVSRLPPGNYKQVLNEYCQKSRVSLPKYTCEYPEDTVGYIACVSVRGKEYRSPPQPSKKVAEMMAAAEAISDLGILTGPVSEKGKPGPPQTVSQSIPSPVEGTTMDLCIGGDAVHVRVGHGDYGWSSTRNIAIFRNMSILIVCVQAAKQGCGLIWQALEYLRVLSAMKCQPCMVMIAVEIPGWLISIMAVGHALDIWVTSL